MKTCENCKKVFQDDMSFCPYCGTKFHDYKEDLKVAMNELFDEKEEVIEKPTYSRVKKQERLKEEKINNLLNKGLTLLIVLIVGALLVGAVMVGEKFLPTKPGIVENTNPTVNDNQESETNDESVVDKNDGQVIDISNVEDGDFYIETLNVNAEDNQVKIEVKCNALAEGNVYLKDSSTLNIGPIQIKKGSNEFYFIVNGQTDYTLVFEAEKSYEYSITKEMLDKALNKN